MPSRRIELILQAERDRVRADGQIHDGVLTGAIGDGGADFFDEAAGLATSTLTPGRMAPDVSLAASSHGAERSARDRRSRRGGSTRDTKSAGQRF